MSELLAKEGQRVITEKGSVFKALRRELQGRSKCHTVHSLLNWKEKYQLPYQKPREEPQKDRITRVVLCIQEHSPGFSMPKDL